MRTSFLITAIHNNTKYDTNYGGTPEPRGQTGRSRRVSSCHVLARLAAPRLQATHPAHTRHLTERPEA